VIGAEKVMRIEGKQAKLRTRCVSAPASTGDLEAPASRGWIPGITTIAYPLGCKPPCKTSTN
jgi:hypothetical protein